MFESPEAASREWTRVVVVKDLGMELQKAAGELERAIGHARSVLDSEHIDAPELVGRKARLLGLLRDAGALLVFAQADQGR